MWATTLAASLTLLCGGAGAFTVDMGVPASAELGSQVVLTAPYQLASFEYIQRLTWSKDGQVFLTYGQRPLSGEFFDVAGVNVNRDQGVIPERVVLENVGFDTSGSYQLSVEVSEETTSGSSSSTYQQTQNLQVGGDSLGNRFGGSARPADTSSTTFISSSSSAGNVPAGTFGGPLGNRFGGSSSGGPLGNRFGGNSGSTGSAQAAQGLGNAVNSLQQAADRLNAIANALNG